MPEIPTAESVGGTNAVVANGKRIISLQLKMQQNFRIKSKDRYANDSKIEM